MAPYLQKKFPVRHVIVTGDCWHVSSAEVEFFLKPEVKTGYFLVNLALLQHRLQTKVPWLQVVTIARQWPDTLVVHLVQKQPLAVWNNTALLSTTGEIFFPDITSFPPDIPHFFAEKPDINDMLRYNQLFTPIADTAGLRIIALTLTVNGSWRVDLSHNIVVMLGDQDILARFTRFANVYRKVFVPEHREPSYVDMRYGHGMAVQWKT